MQNNLYNKRLSKLGIASDDDILTLRRENDRLGQLLDNKDKELQVVKKHFGDLFENIINSRSAINPMFPNIDVDIVTIPNNDRVEIYPSPNGTGVYPDGQGGSTSDQIYPDTYTISSSYNVDAGNSDYTNVDGLISNQNGSLVNNIFWENSCNIFKIDAEDSGSCDAASLTG